MPTAEQLKAIKDAISRGRASDKLARTEIDLARRAGLVDLANDLEKKRAAAVEELDRIDSVYGKL